MSLYMSWGIRYSVGLLKSFSRRVSGQIVLHEVSYFGLYQAHLGFNSCYSQELFPGSVAWISIFCSLKGNSSVMGMEIFPDKSPL